MNFNTMVVHAGSEPDKVTGAVVPNISLATTYAQTNFGVELNGTSDPNSFGILPEKRDLYEKNKNKINFNKDNLNIRPEGEVCVDITKGCALLIMYSNHYVHYE